MYTQFNSGKGVVNNGLGRVIGNILGNKPKADRKSKSKTKTSYCSYCKKQTEHEIDNENKNDLNCTLCGSSRMDKIQGIDSSLM